MGYAYRMQVDAAVAAQAVARGAAARERQAPAVAGRLAPADQAPGLADLDWGVEVRSDRAVLDRAAGPVMDQASGQAGSASALRTPVGHRGTWNTRL